MNHPCTVMYFAAARERVGCSRETVALDAPVLLADFLAQLTQRHPSLVPLLPHLRVAVNQTFVASDAWVAPGSEVALIPPVAGGSLGLFDVVERPLSLDEVVQAVRAEDAGAVVTFSGVVRNQTQGKRVLKLEYEAYPGMAQQQLARIGEEVARRGPQRRIAIVHRVGSLVPGELAVVIAAAAPHRREAFDDCAFALERLKQDVPIWKKEHFEEGSVWVGLQPIPAPS